MSDVLHPDTGVKTPLIAPFRWEGEHVGIELPGGRALFTTRRGGVSAGPYGSLNLAHWTGDDPAAVAANLERLAALVGRPVVHGRQVHGTRVRIATAPGPSPDADGHATAEHDLALAVMTADCLPIALIAPEAVAMLHVGWRGLADGIVEEGVRALRELGASEIRAAIGPGAGGCCYEVRADAAGAFGRPAGRLDLTAISRERLAAAGAAEVHDAGLCTICADPGLLFSHRRDGGVTGRQTGVAWRS